MANWTLEDLSEKMRDIDFCTLTTRTEGGKEAGRPMSNNREVAYQGDSYFFTWDHSRMAQDIGRDPAVGLSFQGKSGLFGKPPVFIFVQGQAELVHDKARFAEHWSSDLDRWFKQGPDTPGVVMIKVHAGRIDYWDGEDDDEVVV